MDNIDVCPPSVKSPQTTERNRLVDMPLRRGASEWFNELAGPHPDITALAGRSDLSRQTIYNVRDKVTNPSQQTIGKLAEAFGVKAPTLDELARRGVESVQRGDQPPAGRLGGRAGTLEAAREVLEGVRQQIAAVEKLLSGDALPPLSATDRVEDALDAHGQQDGQPQGGDDQAAG